MDKTKPNPSCHDCDGEGTGVPMTDGSVRRMPCDRCWPVPVDKRGAKHYTDLDVQPWEVLETILTSEEFIGYLKGNIVKYAMRQGKKEGSDDVEKYRHYVEKLKEVLNGQGESAGGFVPPKW